MATNFNFNFNFNFVNIFPKIPIQSKPIPLTISSPISTFPFPGGFCNTTSSKQHLNNSSSIIQLQVGRRSMKSPPSVSSMFSDDLVIHDYCVAASAGATALFLLWFWGQVAKQGVFDQKLNRKFVHITIGLAFMLFWPLFSPRPEAAILAALIPGVNIIKMLLLGLGVYKDEATVKSMTRYGDHRELLKGPLYYATTITLASFIYWRSSPIPIAAICNMCAGDGMADIVGRRFGKHKLPYNRDKSFMGSIAMVAFGFIACIGYMHYFSAFGLVDESWNLSLRFFIVSLVSALVESLPISSDLDDNLTVPLTSFLVGTLLF